MKITTDFLIDKKTNKISFLKPGTSFQITFLHNNFNKETIEISVGNPKNIDGEHILLSSIISSKNNNLDLIRQIICSSAEFFQAKKAYVVSINPDDTAILSINKDSYLFEFDFGDNINKLPIYFFELSFELINPDKIYGLLNEIYNFCLYTSKINEERYLIKTRNFTVKYLSLSDLNELTYNIIKKICLQTSCKETTLQEITITTFDGCKIIKKLDKVVHISNSKDNLFEF